MRPEQLEQAESNSYLGPKKELSGQNVLKKGEPPPPPTTTQPCSLREKPKVVPAIFASLRLAGFKLVFLFKVHLI